jgi:hypothetical protein
MLSKVASNPDHPPGSELFANDLLTAPAVLTPSTDYTRAFSGKACSLEPVVPYAHLKTPALKERRGLKCSGDEEMNQTSSTDPLIP